MTSPVPTLFRSVDIASLGAALTQRLRDAGIEVGMSATGRLADALTRSTDRSMTTLYWVARITLVHDHRDLATFDAVFADVFDGDGIPRREPRPQPRGSAVVATGTVRRHSSETDGLATVQGRLATTKTASVVEADEADDEPVEPSSIPCWYRPSWRTWPIDTSRHSSPRSCTASANGSSARWRWSIVAAAAGPWRRRHRGPSTCAAPWPGPGRPAARWRCCVGRGRAGDAATW